MLPRICYTLASRLILALVALFSCFSYADTGPVRRIALVIGNGDYQQSALPKLPNPANDAEDIAKVLRGFGFEVIERKDQTLEAMNQAIAEFGSKIGGSDAALFYYAGHGIQVKNQNYLIPVNSTIESEASVPYQGINLNQVLDEMDSGKSKINIVMLDACRNNPISGKFRSAQVSGLASPGITPKGTVIVYATDPGNVAADGDGRNGLFTRGLLTAFRGKDLSLDGVLTVASAEVERVSGQTQTPYVNGPKTLQKTFYFRAVPDSVGKESEKAAWARIEQSTKAADFVAYLQTYPTGAHAELAGKKLTQLGGKQHAAISIPPTETYAVLSSGLETCLHQAADSRICLDQLKDYVRKNPEDELSVARLVRHRFNSSVALPFFESIVAKQGKSACSDEDLAIAVISGLELPGDYAEAAIARRLYAGACRAELDVQVNKALSAENGHSFLKDNACPILGKNGKVPVSCKSVPEPEPVVAESEVLPKIDKKSVTLEKTKAYRGGEGETVTITPIKGGELYLLGFDGMRGPWDGRTLLHKREDRGHGNADFWTESSGKRWNTIVLRNDTMAVYVPDYKTGNGFVIKYSDEATKGADAAAQLEAWKP